jgi:hypothetical protein
MFFQNHNNCSLNYSEERHFSEKIHRQSLHHFVDNVFQYKPYYSKKRNLPFAVKSGNVQIARLFLEDEAQSEKQPYKGISFLNLLQSSIDECQILPILLLELKTMISVHFFYILPECCHIFS